MDFLEKVLERLKGYSCGEHKQLEKMILNQMKRKKLVYVVSFEALTKKIRKLEQDEEKKVKGNPIKAVEAITYCAAFYDLAREIGMELEDPTEADHNKAKRGRK